MKFPLIEINTKSANIIGINNSLKIQILFKNIKRIFMSNYKDILCNKKTNKLYSILKKAINYTGFFYLKKEFLKYCRKYKIELNFFDFIDFFINKNMLFSLIVNKVALLKYIRLLIKQYDFFYILNINDYLPLANTSIDNQDYNFYMKWKNK